MEWLIHAFREGEAVGAVPAISSAVMASSDGFFDIFGRGFLLRYQSSSADDLNVVWLNLDRGKINELASGDGIPTRTMMSWRKHY